MRERLRRVPLLTRFSILSLVVVAGLGVLVASVLAQRIERRALGNAVEVARVAGDGLRADLRAADLARPIRDRARLTALDRHASGPKVQRIKVFNDAGLLVYSDDRATIGDSHADSHHVQAALEGEVEAEVEHGVSDTHEGDKVLEVYLPLTALDGSDAIEGVFEVYLPYEPVAAAIADDRRTLYLLLAGGLLTLWATLSWLVAGAARRLRHQALHDALTELPNRRRLYERGARMLGGEQGALLLIDLDHFREVNDTLGHEHGDALLVEVGERLGAALRRRDLLARLGGDEFAVLVGALPHRGAAAELAMRLHAALARPFVVAGVAVELEASIGIALHPEHGGDVATLLQRADVALYEAKRTSTRVETYAFERDPHSSDRLALLAELRTAIDEDQLVLEYQPKIDVGAGRITGVEALVRWRHPTRGLLAPAEFVPLAERTGMIALVTRWVLDAALRQAAAWRERGIEVPVAVNLAAANVIDPQLPDVVADRLRRWDVPGDQLVCEISEHTVMTDEQRVCEVLCRLREMHVRVSLDDFGSGRSSLAYLKQLPLDELKIDRSFVAAMASEAGDAAIVRTTIELAHSLGMRIVAEGVEDARTLELLRALRCDEAQGFLIARPLSPEALEAWLARRAQAAATR